MRRRGRAGRAGGLDALGLAARASACLAVAACWWARVAAVAALLCPETYLLCTTQRPRGSVQHCVAPAFVCDGFNDCQSGLDERNCQGRCQGGAKECDGRCILAAYWCDGERDCADGADEAACQGFVPDARDLVECPPRTRRPGASAPSPILRRGSLWCDGRSDCRSARDERSCRKPSLCRAGAMHCISAGDNGPGMPRCVHASALCDGYPDCDDGSDERDCAQGTRAPPTSTSSPPTTPRQGLPPARSGAAEGEPHQGHVGQGATTLIPVPDSAPAARQPSSLPGVQLVPPPGPDQTPFAHTGSAGAAPGQGPASSPGGLLVIRDGLPVYAWILILALAKIVVGLTYFWVRRSCYSRGVEDGGQGVEKAVSFVFVGSSAEQVANGQHRAQPLAHTEEHDVDLLGPCACAAPGAPVAVAAEPTPPRLPPPLRPQRSVPDEIYETLRAATRPGVDLLLSTLEDVVYATPSVGE